MSGRDNRQFKGAPYQNPRIFPPPSEEAWEEIGVTAPAPSSVAARNSTGRDRKRTSWRITSKDGTERREEIVVPVSGSVEEAQERYRQNERDQAIRYGFSPPSYTRLDAERDEEAMRP